jgi:hypothetical protein
MPYLVPAWLFSSIGMSTRKLAIVMVRKACSQPMPSAISPEASR